MVFQSNEMKKLRERTGCDVAEMHSKCRASLDGALLMQHRELERCGTPPRRGLASSAIQIILVGRVSLGIGPLTAVKRQGIARILRSTWLMTNGKSFRTLGELVVVPEPTDEPATL